MKSNCKIGMVLLASVTMGGLAVEGLHAQAKTGIAVHVDRTETGPQA
jgi:hypothetical protein